MIGQWVCQLLSGNSRHCNCTDFRSDTFRSEMSLILETSPTSDGPVGSCRVSRNPEPDYSPRSQTILLPWQKFEIWLTREFWNASCICSSSLLLLLFLVTFSSFHCRITKAKAPFCFLPTLREKKTSYSWNYFYTHLSAAWDGHGELAVLSQAVFIVLLWTPDSCWWTHSFVIFYSYLNLLIYNFLSIVCFFLWIIAL